MPEARKGRILQICPEIGPGSGVAAVAHHLEVEWAARGFSVERFTLKEARGGWLPRPGRGWRGRVTLLLRVVWFSTVGTALARRYLRRSPVWVSVCHNDVLAGDVYVNHGIVQAAMRARGSYTMRMVRNPLHIFTAARDRLRYGGGAGHRLVVNLVEEEERSLRSTYPNLNIPTVVIGNGVDVGTFRPATQGERARAREELGLDLSSLVVLFVGHEYDRKGLKYVMDAMETRGDGAHVVVVGGTPDMVRAGQRDAATRGIGHRSHFVGARSDPRPYFHAADVFALPSAYESYGLVVLEALACGLPVIATPTGCVPDVIVDGENGWVVGASGAEISQALERVAHADTDSMRRAARRSAEQHSWGEIAAAYADVFEQLAAADMVDGRDEAP